MPGPFKNKISFEGVVVSIQSALSLNAAEIKPIHTQAYLGPRNGWLTIKFDADNEVQEAREDNNEFSVNVVFRGF